MNEQEQAMQQIIALVQAAMQGDQEAQAKIQQIMQAAQQGDPQAQEIATVIQQVIQEAQKSQQPAIARKGAKLNYLRRISDQCPEGYKMEIFAKGGNVVRRCKKCEEAERQARQENSKPKNVIDEFKCGRKMKK